MKKGMLRLFILAVVALALAFPMVAQADTYEFSWVAVQHKIYASGTERNQVGFNIMNSDTGAELTDNTMILGIVLKDPNGTAVTLTDQSGSPFEYLGGYYDGWTNKWIYNTSYTMGNFASNITEELIPGTYQLEIQLEGQTISSAYEFVEQIDMPTVDSNSFKISKDVSGNLMWTWDSPLYQNVSAQGTVAKARISIFNQGQFVALGQIQVPTNMGYLFVPADIVATVESQGDEFRFQIQVRQTNNNNRGYSNQVTVYGSLDGGNYAPVGTTADNTPDFTWQHDNSVSWYKLYVEDGPDAPIFKKWYDASEICSNGSCQVSPEELGAITGGDYKWYIKSWISNDSSSWNDGTSFTLIE